MFPTLLTRSLLFSSSKILYVTNPLANRYFWTLLLGDLNFFTTFLNNCTEFCSPIAKELVEDEELKD